MWGQATPGGDRAGIESWSLLGGEDRVYTEELYKKVLHNLDNHDGVITHLKPDILECEVNVGLRKHRYEQS